MYKKEWYKENFPQNNNELVYFGVLEGVISGDAVFDKLKNNFQVVFNLCNDCMSCNQNTSLTRDLNANSFHKVFPCVASININE